MFHIMLVLMLLFVVIGVIMFIFFNILLIIGACIGGTSVAILVKNKLIKKLLILGFAIAFFTGVLFLTPFIMSYADLSRIFFVIFFAAIYLILIMLAFSGIKTSSALNNKTANHILIAIFCIILIVTAISAIITLAMTLMSANYF